MARSDGARTAGPTIRAGHAGQQREDVREGGRRPAPTSCSSTSRTPARRSPRRAPAGIAVAALTELDWGRTVRAVRVNGLETHWCHDDIIEVVTGARDALDVLIVPKARSARDVWWVDVLLTQLETKLGLQQAHRPRGAHRGVRGPRQRGRDRQGQRPARGDHLRRRRPVGVAAGAGRRQLRPGQRVPRRLLALRPLPGGHRRPGRRDRRHRRAVSRLPGPRRLPAQRRARQPARLRRQVGDPPEPDPDRQRGVLADGRGGRGGRSRRSRTTARPRPRASAPSGATAGSSTPPTCAWPRTCSTRRRWPAAA